MKVISILCSSLTLFSSYEQIQKGIVKYASGAEIENTYIINANSQSHAHSNEFGSFSIDKTSLGNIFEISALGYKKANFKVKDDDSTLVLENDVYSLEQVVIQSKLNAMNVILKIDLVAAPVNSSQEILRKMPGIFISRQEHLSF